MTVPIDSLARWGGLALGLALASALLLTWRTPAASRELGADLRMVASPVGELQLEPAGAFLSGRSLGPGDQAAGNFRVRNLTGRSVAVRFRGLPSSHDLDKRVTAELRSGGRVLARGSLGELRGWTKTPLTLRRGETREVEARLSLPERSWDGYRGRIVDVTLELSAKRTEQRS